MTAKNKQKTRKQPARSPLGIPVGNRIRVDAYFENREEVEQLDLCADVCGQSRSRFVTVATKERMARVCKEHGL